MNKNVPISAFFMLLSSATLEASIIARCTFYLRHAILGNYALHEQVSMGAVYAVKELIEHAKTCRQDIAHYVNLRDNLGRTALHYACMAQRNEIAKILLHHGACPTAPDREKYTPLFWAKTLGNQPLVVLLAQYEKNKDYPQ